MDNKNNGTGIKSAVCIGGSAGSMMTVIYLLREIIMTPDLVLFICIHRGKNQTQNFCNLLSQKSGKLIVEPDDKDPIEFGKCYLAPANYHLTIDRDNYISLSYEDEVHFSRPSIDVMFHSVAEHYKDQAVGIILSGANTDGADGLLHIHKEKGFCIIQDPETAIVETMPRACKQNNPDVFSYEPEHIAEFINLLQEIKSKE